MCVLRTKECEKNELHTMPRIIWMSQRHTIVNSLFLWMHIAFFRRQFFCICIQTQWNSSSIETEKSRNQKHTHQPHLKHKYIAHSPARRSPENGSSHPRRGGKGSGDRNDRQKTQGDSVVHSLSIYGFLLNNKKICGVENEMEPML